MYTEREIGSFSAALKLALINQVDTVYRESWGADTYIAITGNSLEYYYHGEKQKWFPKAKEFLAMDWKAKL